MSCLALGVTLLTAAATPYFTNRMSAIPIGAYSANYHHESMVGTVMDPEVDAAWDAVRRKVYCLLAAAPNNAGGARNRRSSLGDNGMPLTDEQAGRLFDTNNGTFRVVNDASAMSAALRHLGAQIDDGIRELEGKIERHFVRFFEHVKRRADEDLALWLPKSVSTTALVEAMREQSRAAGLAGHGSAIAPAVRPQRVDHAAGTDALHAWLHIQLEAVMTATRATKGAVYLRSADGSGYVRAVAKYPAEVDLPADMALASGSTVGVVVLTGVGVNVERSRHGQQANEERRVPERLTAPPLRVNTAIVMPIGLPNAQGPGSGPPGVAGCLVIGDKRGGGPFDHVDEHRAVSFCSMAQSVVYRYGYAPFVNGKPSWDQPLSGPLRSLSLFPPAHECPWNADSAAANQLPLWDAKQLVMRQGTAHATLTAKEMSAAGGTAAAPGAQARVLSDEDIIETVAPYILNLEALWRKALDSITDLRNEATKQESQLSMKQTRIVELEVALRNVTKTVARLRADLNVLKRAAPGHMKGESAAGGDVTGLPLADTTSGTFDGALVPVSSGGAAGSIGLVPPKPTGLLPQLPKMLLAEQFSASAKAARTARQPLANGAAAPAKRPAPPTTSRSAAAASL